MKQLTQLNTPEKKWGCGTIALLAVLACAAVFVLPQLFGGNNDNNNDVANNNNNNQQDNTNNNDGNAQSANANINLGALMLAESIDRDGCAINATSSLQRTGRFYVVAPNSQFPNGTDIFARLYRDDVAVEDLPLITANQDYSNTCVNFVFETVNGSNFQTGSYEAEFWVNGNAYNSIRFNIN